MSSASATALAHLIRGLFAGSQGVSAFGLGGVSHGFVGAISERGLEVWVGFDVTESVREAILQLQKASWVEAIIEEM